MLRGAGVEIKEWCFWDPRVTSGLDDLLGRFFSILSRLHFQLSRDHVNQSFTLGFNLANAPVQTSSLTHKVLEPLSANRKITGLPLFLCPYRLGIVIERLSCGTSEFFRLGRIRGNGGKLVADYIDEILGSLARVDG